MSHLPCARARLRRTVALVAAAVVAVLALTACEPTTDPAGGRDGPTAASTGDGARGSPVAGMPAGLAELREQGLSSAEQWQDTPVLSEIEIEVDAERRWTSAGLTYLAADADRMFEFRVTPDGTTQQRPTLATLGIQPVTADGIAAVPAPPDGLGEPAALLEAAVPLLEACGAAGAPDRVLYATGAPISWDGSRWTQALRWTATITTPDAALVVDPVSMEQLPGESCVTRESVPAPTEGAT